EDVTGRTVEILSKKAAVDDKGILLDTLKVKLDETSGELKPNEDYVAAFASDGSVVITPISGGSIPDTQASLFVSYRKLAPEKVTALDIIGGVDVETGKATGLELINEVFPKFGLVPGIILAPRFSQDPMVEAVMKAKASNINSFFKAIAAVDVNISEANTYTKAVEWK